MKPILNARLSSRDGRGVTLDCGDDHTMRIVALAEDLVRVTVLRGGDVRQKRSWSVPAYGTDDTEWAGRLRLDDASWPPAPVEIEASEAAVSLATRALRLNVTLHGLRMDWSLPEGVLRPKNARLPPCDGARSRRPPFRRGR
jgi:alpha-glucosidase